MVACGPGRPIEEELPDQVLRGACRQSGGCALFPLPLRQLAGCTTPAYEYTPTAASGALTVAQAEKACQYEISLAHGYIEPFSVKAAEASNQFGMCMQAKGFEQRLVGNRNIYTGTVTPTAQ
jgi:hypothetical protein